MCGYAQVRFRDVRVKFGVSSLLLGIRLGSSGLGARNTLSHPAVSKNVICNEETEVKRKVHCLVRPRPAHCREHCLSPAEGEAGRQSKAHSREIHCAKGELIPVLCLRRLLRGEARNRRGLRSQGWKQKVGSVTQEELSIFVWGKEKTFLMGIPCCIKIKQNPSRLRHHRNLLSISSGRPVSLTGEIKPSPLAGGRQIHPGQGCILLRLTTSFCQLQDALRGEEYCCQMCFRDLRVTWSLAQL